MKLPRYVLIAAAAAVTVGCGPSRKHLVKQMFTSPDADLRRSAVEQLSGSGAGRRDPYLKAYAAMTSDPAASVRSAAVRALGRAGDARYVKEVVAALKDRDATVRWDAAVALDSLVDEQAVPPLSERAASDSLADVRASAVRALRHYPRKDVLATLLQCLGDAAFCVRFRAAESLKELTGESAEPDAERWRRILEAKTDPFAKSPQPKRPWWDWLGVTGQKRSSSRSAGTPNPK